MKWSISRFGIILDTVEADRCRITEGGALVFESFERGPSGGYRVPRVATLVASYSPTAWARVEPQKEVSE